MRTPLFYASVYGIIKNDQGKILCSKRGKKANGYTGRYQIPAGHIDGGETIFEALKREMKEELTIDILEKNVSLKHTVHRTFADGREYFDFYFEIYDFSGEIKIGEIDKCSDLTYRAMDDLEKINLLNHDKIAIRNIHQGLKFSELFLKDSEY